MKSKHGFETTLERSALMRKIKGSNTKPELFLRKALWKEGYRYRINVSKLPGKPDIVIKSQKLAIFIDGDFWHGYMWSEKKDKIQSNKEYWINKIEGNMSRDKKNNRSLQLLGYTVLRFWEWQIKKDLINCLEKIKGTINLNNFPS